MEDAQPAQIPVLEEGTPALSPQEPQPEHQQGLASGLPTLQLPPAGGHPSTAGPEAESAVAGVVSGGRRWSFDASDWEVLSHHDGQQSHCGSSPRSVSPSEAAYDSDAEHAAAAAAAAATAAAAVAAALRSPLPPPQQPRTAAQTLALPLPAAPAQPLPSPTSGAELGADPALQPFGSFVLPGGEPLLAAAAATGENAGEGKGVRSGQGSQAGSQVSSPRSSFERASSRASRHDLYSLSQDDSGDCMSDRDIDEMMAAGEPDMHSRDHELAPAGPATDASGKPLPPPPVPLAAAPAITLAAAVRGAYCASASQLHALAASFTAYLARIVPASADVANRFARGMAEIVGSLRERLAPMPLGLGLDSLPASASAISERVQLAVQSAVKQHPYALKQRINWFKVALALGGACTLMAALLHRSNKQNARLAALLARRETDFSNLLMKIAELQRNISHYSSNRGVPIIRHVSTVSAIASAGSGGGAGTSACWPAIVVV